MLTIKNKPTESIIPKILRKYQPQIVLFSSPQQTCIEWKDMIDFEITDFSLEDHVSSSSNSPVEKQPATWSFAQHSPKRTSPKFTSGVWTL